MDAEERSGTDSLEEVSFFEPTRLTPAEKREVNLALATIGRRMCEVCDQEDDLVNFPGFTYDGRHHYRYQCFACRSTLRAKQMKVRYDSDPEYRQAKVQAAQDYRDSLTDKSHYRSEARKRSARQRGKL